MRRWRQAFVNVRSEDYVKPSLEDRELLERFIARNVDFDNPTLDEIKRLKAEAEKHLLIFSLRTVYGIYIDLRKHGKTKLGFKVVPARSPARNPIAGAQA